MKSSSSAKDLIDEIRRIVACESSPEFERASVAAKADLQFQKWRLIHKFIHAHPFPTKTRLCRSEQWMDAARHVRDIAEVEVLDWVLLQAEVARNLEKGVQDLRPRKNGPCHELLLEYVGNRKRKALAVYKWAAAADESSTATNDTLTLEILKRHDTRGIGGTENI